MPLVHLITNSATINDTVNAILAVGVEAVAADCSLEAADITNHADALYINMGMPNADKRTAYLRAAKAANDKEIPIVLDPVGVFASSFRKSIVRELVDDISFACIKGNEKEMSALCALLGIEGEDLTQLSKLTKAVIVRTGASNEIVDADHRVTVPGGSSYLTRFTGGGCILGGVITAMLASHADCFDTVVHAMKFYNESAQEAEVMMGSLTIQGTVTYKNLLIDLLSTRLN